MIGSLKSRLDQFLGRGQAAVTVPSLDGALKPNNRLDEALAGIKGEAPDNLMLCNGQILWSEGSQIFFGPEKALFAQMESDVTALASVKDGMLAVALSEGGLQMLDGKGQQVNTLAGFEISCVTAMEFVTPEKLVVAIGSTENSINNWARDLLEQRSSGQLVMLDLMSGQSNVIAQNLAYPSGLLQVADDTLIVSEAWTSRVLQIDISSGEKVPIMEDLPAYPGRICRSKAGGYWLCMFAPRSPLTEFVLREPVYRKEMMAEVAPEFWIAPALRSGYSFHEPMQGGALKQMGILKPWAPTRSYGLVIEIDERFVPVRSFHSRAGGKRHGITSALPQNDLLWVTSKGGQETFSINLGTDVIDGENV